MWQELIGSLISSRLRFEWRYWRGQTPWDTQITPPEVMEFIENKSWGKALDLGCGTGTNAITLARHGWQVTGVDFSSKAIRQARRKAAAKGLKIEFHAADVTDLGMLTGPYDYVLDIGCLFGLKENDRIRYAGELARLLRPQGEYMLYAWLPRPWKGGLRGISAEAVEALLHDAFLRTRFVIGEEKSFPSAWYWYRRHKSNSTDAARTAARYMPFFPGGIHHKAVQLALAYLQETTPSRRRGEQPATP